MTINTPVGRRCCSKLGSCSMGCGLRPAVLRTFISTGRISAKLKLVPRMCADGIAQIASSTPAAKLKAWILSHSKSLPTDLTPTELGRPGGFGMVAQEAVGKGQELVRVPTKLLMTAGTASRMPEYGKLIIDNELTEWQALTLHLICERAVGEDSFWYPYLAMLGDQCRHATP